MFFCYIVISKHGKIGIYDGKINLLVEYDVFFIRTGVIKRVRDVWITAAIYLSVSIQLILDMEIVIDSKFISTGHPVPRHNSIRQKYYDIRCINFVSHSHFSHNWTDQYSNRI